MKHLNPLIVAISTLCAPLAQGQCLYADTQQVKLTTPDVLKKGADACNYFRQMQLEAGVQDPDRSYIFYKSLMMAEVLFDHSGQLKAHLCPLMKNYFISDAPSAEDKHAEYVLNQLDSSWKPFFATVKAPLDPSSTASLTLRALFNLSPETPVTDYHAKVAVLAALFAPSSHPLCKTQVSGTVCTYGSEEDFRQAAQDYADIVKNGYLNRLVVTEKDKFFYLPTLPDADCTKEFAIDGEGNLIGSSTDLLHVPGFVAAVRVMGGEYTPHLMKSTVNLLSGAGSTGVIKVTAARVIQSLAQVIAANTPESSPEALYVQGLYAFSSLTNNPVVRATEAAFAEIAENRSESPIRSGINSCLMNTLSPVWSMFDNADAKFQDAFVRSFNASYRLVYNHAIPSPATQGETFTSGFQLYKRDTYEAEVIGRRIRTPQDFQNLVLDAIERTAVHLEYTPLAVSVSQQLVSYVQQDAFLKMFFWNYDAANRQELDPVVYYETLYRTPMQTCEGTNVMAPLTTNAVVVSPNLGVDRQLDATHPVLFPAHAEELLEWCLNISKHAPKEYLPMNNGMRDFHFSPTTNEMLAFQRSDMKGAEWIRSTLVVPGMQVASQPVDPRTQQRVISTLGTFVTTQGVSSAAYQNAVSQIAANPSVQQFAEAIVTAVCNLLIPNPTISAEVATLVDSILIDSLPPASQAILQNTAVRFAFIEWKSARRKKKNAFLCGYFNPRTGRVGLGTIREDKTNLKPLNEQLWVHQQKWEVKMDSFSSSLANAR